MKTKALLILTAFVTLFTACQKDPEETNENGTTTEDYQPTTTGSTWQYTSSTSGTYTETSLGTDTTIEGKKFYKFDNDANGRRYINKENGVYTTYGYIEQLQETVSLVYLKDLPAGTTWTNNLSYSGIPVEFKYNVVSRDGEKTVNGKSFKDVIALAFTISANSPLLGGNITVATGNQFYAKGVGSITSTFHFSGLGTTVNDSTYLVNHSIK